MSRDFHDPLPKPPTYNDTFLATPHFIDDLPPPPHFDDYGEIKRKDPEEIDERLRHYLTADSNVTWNQKLIIFPMKLKNIQIQLPSRTRLRPENRLHNLKIYILNYFCLSLYTPDFLSTHPPTHHAKCQIKF